MLLNFICLQAMNCNKSSFPCSSTIYFLSFTVVWKATVAQQYCQEAPKAHLDSEKQILLFESRVYWSDSPHPGNTDKYTVIVYYSVYSTWYFIYIFIYIEFIWCIYSRGQGWEIRDRGIISCLSHPVPCGRNGTRSTFSGIYNNIYIYIYNYRSIRNFLVTADN